MTAIEFNYQLTSLEDKLRYFAYRLTSDINEVNDLVQETYLKSITNRERFMDKTNLTAWLYTIMKNIFINKYRRSKLMNSTIDLQDSYSQSTLLKPTDMGLPHSEMVAGEIQEVISDLDSSYRVPFEMYNEGHKYKEISEELGVSLSTVKNRIFWARKKLKDNLKEYQYA